jgi:hypothetical protein
MAIIPAGSKLQWIDSSVPTPERKSTRSNAKTEMYTIEDVSDASLSSLLKNEEIGLFIDGTYERSYIEDATGEVIDITALEAQSNFSSAAIGDYVLSQNDGQITTNGGGENLILTLRVSELEENLFYIDFENSSFGPYNGILDLSFGFNDGDSIFIKSIDLGGTDEEEVIEIVLQEGATFQGSERYAGISVDTKTGVIIYGGLIIDTSTLPTEDPQINGAVWVDTNNDNVLKVSIGN